MPISECPRCGHKVGGLAKVCSGCGHPLAASIQTTVTEGPPSEGSATGEPPSRTGHRDLVSCRLDHGYTEFSLRALPGVPFPLAHTCSVCGEPVSEKTAGGIKEFETTIRHTMPLDGWLEQTSTWKFTGRVYLCRTCAAAGLRLEDYIQFGFAAGTLPHLMLQIGNDKVAETWRAVLQIYERRVHEAVRERVKQESGETIWPAFPTVRSEARYSPEAPDWKAPLRNTPRAAGKGCLVLLAALGGVLCFCVSGLLAWLV